MATLEDVVVEGRSLPEVARAFVDEVTRPPRGRGPARWHRTVCVGTVNLRRESAQVLIDRVSEIADSVGLEPAEPGCDANILIIATDNASALTAALVEARPNAFRPGYSGASLSRAALDNFQNSTRPVRWWHVSVPVDRDTGQIAVRLPGEDPPLIDGSGGRLRTNVTNRLLRALVIVDITQMEGLSFQQLGDYVAMISLAQVDPEVDVAGFQSVLNLFDGQSENQSLTEWDSAYLRALYDAELNQKATNAQMGEGGSAMARDRSRPDEAPPVP